MSHIDAPGIDSNPRSPRPSGDFPLSGRAQHLFAHDTAFARGSAADRSPACEVPEGLAEYRLRALPWTASYRAGSFQQAAEKGLQRASSASLVRSRLRNTASIYRHSLLSHREPISLRLFFSSLLAGTPRLRTRTHRHARGSPEKTMVAFLVIRTICGCTPHGAFVLYPGHTAAVTIAGQREVNDDLHAAAPDESGRTSDPEKSDDVNLEPCIFCKRPVLEITGQFEKLDTYFLKKDDELFRQKIFGSCHTSCLQASKWGGAWYRKRLEYAKNMGLRVLKIAGNHCVLDRGQAREVCHADGTRAILDKHEVPPPSGIMPIRQAYNVELDDAAFVVSIRATLAESGRFPLWKLIEHLKIADRMLQTELLTYATASLQSPPAPVIGNWLSLILAYDYRLPQELMNLPK